MTQSDQDGSPPENTPEQPQPLASNDQTIWAVLIHLSGFAGLFFFGLQIIAPLVLWLVTRPNREMVNSHGKAALNFQISMILYQIALGIVIVIFVIGVAAANSERLADLADNSMTDEEQFSEVLSVFLRPILIAAGLGIVTFLFWAIMIIRAAVRAGGGKTAGYILAIPFLR